MMDRFEIDGGSQLSGEITCAGSKNATLPMMAAALLTNGKTIIHNVPELMDIQMMSMVLRVVGADVHLKGTTITIDSEHCNFWEAPYELVRKMRASFYVLGPLVARFGQARISLPGGCNLGPRPVDLHLKGMEQLGCTVDFDAGYIIVKAEKMIGTEISLEIPSVGATGNLMMAATAAEGMTTINNAACDPEIECLARMLKQMGANIDGHGTSVIKIEGSTKLQPVEIETIPDRIEAATFLIAGTITRSKISVRECNPAHLGLFLDKLKGTGVTISTESSLISIDATDSDLIGVDVKTGVYPGFPTDLQAPWTALMSLNKGSATITDTIYPERFSHVPELNRLGARISMNMNNAYIRGVEKLQGTSVMCSDIRAAGAIVTAALAAQGHSEVLRIYHLDRGYHKMEDKLTSLGARIRRVRE